MTPDDAYANAPFIDGAEGFPPRWAAEAAEFRAALGFHAQTGTSYGASARQVFDLFEPTGVARGTVFFVHGGYWKAFDSASWSHLAKGPIARGWAVAMPSYDLCPQVSIADIARQIAAALEQVAERRPGPLALAGHSAGAHLVARVMDPLLSRAEVRDRVGQIVSISPIADLAPLRETQMNDTLGITEDIARSESPVNMSPPHGVNVTVWVGALERPGFLEQAEALSKAWGARKHVLEARHHFDIIEELTDPASAMVGALLGDK